MAGRSCLGTPRSRAPAEGGTCHAAPLAKTFGVVPRLRDEGGSTLNSVKERGSHGALRSQLLVTT